MLPPIEKGELGVDGGEGPLLGLSEACADQACLVITILAMHQHGVGLHIHDNAQYTTNYGVMCWEGKGLVDVFQIHKQQLYPTGFIEGYHLLGIFTLLVVLVTKTYDRFQLQVLLYKFLISWIWVGRSEDVLVDHTKVVAGDDGPGGSPVGGETLNNQPITTAILSSWGWWWLCLS